MIGSASEKAEYKKTMIPYVVGAVLVFAGTSLVKVIYSLATAVTNKIILHEYYISITIKLKVHVNALFFVFRLHFVTICAII